MTTPGTVIEVRLALTADPAIDLDRILALLRDLATEPIVDRVARTLTFAVTDGLSTLAEIARRLAASDVPGEEVRLRRPTPVEPPARPAGAPGRPIKRSGPRPGGTPA
jgi:hypothetical protein